MDTQQTLYSNIIYQAKKSFGQLREVRDFSDNTMQKKTVDYGQVITLKGAYDVSTLLFLTKTLKDFLVNPMQKITMSR